MAIIKKTEFSTLDSNALQKKLADIEKEILREKGAIHNAGKPKNPGKYREMRKLRARINTALNSLSKKSNAAASAKKAEKPAAKPAPAKTPSKA